MEKSAQLFETLPTDTCFPAFSLRRRAIAAARGYQKNDLIRCHPPSSSETFFGATFFGATHLRDGKLRVTGGVAKQTHLGVDGFEPIWEPSRFGRFGSHRFGSHPPSATGSFNRVFRGLRGTCDS
jgi:hypothetical protein